MSLCGAKSKYVPSKAQASDDSVPPSEPQIAATQLQASDDSVSPSESWIFESQTS